MTTAAVQAEQSIAEVARQIVAESTATQGLPYHVTDEAVLHRVARIMTADPTPGND